MSFNIDYDGVGEPEALREKITPFLTKRRANFLTVISSEKPDPIYKQIDLAAIPATYVFDQQGELRKRFDNDANEYGEEGYSYEQQIIPLVEELLDES